jgi:protein phosphatase-4 regulatory subunit 3
MIQEELFGPILNIVVATMPRDNLLNSACLEFFDFIKREDVRPLIIHLVEHYRDQLSNITYVDTFSGVNGFIDRYDSTQGFAPSMSSMPDTEEDTPKRSETGRGSRWDSGIKDLDATEEEYFNTSDDEEETMEKLSTNAGAINGTSPASKLLVDYPSDEENESMDVEEAEMSAGILPSNGLTPESETTNDSENEPILTPGSSTGPIPPERLSEKRRREEDEEDDLGKLVQQHKRRNSSSSSGSVSSNPNGLIRKRKSFSNGAHGSHGAKSNKIAISLSPAIKTGGEGKSGEDES